MAAVNPKIKRVKGLNKVLLNLNKEIAKIKGRSMVGLIEASMVIHMDMEKTSPTVPADLGNLRASWFTVTATGTKDGTSPDFDNKKGKAAELMSDHSQAVSTAKGLATKFGHTLLIMGFSANYAVFVHEMVGGDKSINWGRPGSGAKFFEAALNRNKQKILKIMQENAYIR